MRFVLSRSLSIFAFLALISTSGMLHAAAKTVYPEGQQDLIAAEESHKGHNFIEVRDVEVVQVLPEDHKGLPHQKFYVELADGQHVMLVYNIDMGEHLPLKVGDIVSAGGQYIPDKDGGLLHWLHADPAHHRPDGYVILNGVRFGD